MTEDPTYSLDQYIAMMMIGDVDGHPPVRDYIKVICTDRDFALSFAEWAASDPLVKNVDDDDPAVGLSRRLSEWAALGYGVTVFWSECWATSFRVSFPKWQLGGLPSLSEVREQQLVRVTERALQVAEAIIEYRLNGRTEVQTEKALLRWDYHGDGTLGEAMMDYHVRVIGHWESRCFALETAIAKRGKVTT